MGGRIYLEALDRATPSARRGLLPGGLPLKMNRVMASRPGGMYQWKKESPRTLRFEGFDDSIVGLYILPLPQASVSGKTMALNMVPIALYL